MIKPVSVRDFLVKMIATFFGAGYSPWAPGTMGSLAGFILVWFLGLNSAVWLALFILSGFIVCKPAVRIFSLNDPQCFVMDEVCGIMTAVFLVPKVFNLYLAGFALFRFFDIVKPWPISWIQKQKHPSAIMWDDLVAGFFANILIHGYLFFVR